MCTNKNKRKKFRWDRLRKIIVVMTLLLSFQRIMGAMFKQADITLANQDKTEIVEQQTKENEEQNEVDKNVNNLAHIYEGTKPTIEPTTLAVHTTAETTEIETEQLKVYSARLNRYMTEYEMYLLVMIACSESGFEEFEGKVAVVATILNRMESPRFPNEVYDVIFQAGQFSSATNGRFHNSSEELRYQDIQSWMLKEAQDAVFEALQGADPTRNITGGSLFFYNPDYCPEEELEMRSTLSCTQRIGNHIFYRDWT